MANYKKHTSSLKGQNPPTSLDVTYFKCMMDQITVKLQLSMKELLNDALIALKSELKLSTKRMKIKVDSCEQRVGQIKDVMESGLVTMNSEINALDRMVNRSNFIVLEGLNDIPGTVIKKAKHFSVTIALHDINFVGYMKNNKTIMVTLNSIAIRDVLMGMYFKDVKVRPLYAVNWIDDPKFTKFAVAHTRQRSSCPAAGELDKTCADLHKKDRIVRFRIVNTIKPYVVLVLSDSNTTKLDL
uniref:Uncharacterized protein n=1 Tax=Glossina pallidipes TaxID=7398 RepID=A0A1A9Z8K4_GLOPL